MAAADQLTGLMSIINSVTGGGGKTVKTSTSGGTSTKQTKLSDVAVNEQIKRILAGSGGVKDIGTAARRSGLYNSTTEDTALGNLYATAAAQGEIARAPTVVTTTPTQTTEKVSAEKTNPLAIVGTIAGASLLNSLFNSGDSKGGGNGIVDMLGGLFGGDSSTGKKSITDGLDTNLSSFDNGYGLSTGVTNQTGNWAGGSFDTGEGTGLGDLTGGRGLGYDKGTQQNDSGGGFDLGGAISGALSGLTGGGLGSFIGGLTGGTGASSSGGSTSGGSVICTALMEQGDLDNELYAKGSEYLNQLNPLTKVGYQFWAIGVAQKIRRGSALVTWVCKPVARSRTGLLASSGSFFAHCKHPLGTITKYIGEPVCWAIGWTVVQLALLESLAGDFSNNFDAE